MHKKSLYTLWGVLFILCAALGFIQERGTSAKIILFLVSLLFFLPPLALVLKASREKDLLSLKLMRNLSFLSLLSTLLLIVLNILSALWPRILGDILHSVLTIVSSPMLCCGNWFLSMFFWACLLMLSLRELKKGK